jgi:hypothetical protein
MSGPERPQPERDAPDDADTEAVWAPVERTRAEEDELIARWLRPDPEDPTPAAWRVTEKGPQIWALAGYLEEASAAGSTDPAHQAWLLKMAAQDFWVPREAISAAFVFYHRHRAAVDAVAEANRPIGSGGDEADTRAATAAGEAAGSAPA